MITRRNCFVINVNYGCSVDVFANFASMFATLIVALELIISNSINDYKLTKAWRLFQGVYYRLNKITSNPYIIFLNVVILFNALDEIKICWTVFSD